MLPLINARVVTEIQAFDILFGLIAVHVGGGGVSGSEGTVVIAVKGDEAPVRAAIALVESLKGEPPLRLKKRRCDTCSAPPPASTPGTAAGADEPRVGKQSVSTGRSPR